MTCMSYDKNNTESSLDVSLLPDGYMIPIDTDFLNRQRALSPGSGLSASDGK